MSSDGFHHRSNFKSKQKPFKGKSKGKIDRANRGKIDARANNVLAGIANTSGVSAGVGGGLHRVNIRNSMELPTKQARVNKAKQIQKQRREELLASKRIGQKTGPPKMVALISLAHNVQLNKITQQLTQYAQETMNDYKTSSSSSSSSSSASSSSSFSSSLPFKQSPNLHNLTINMSGRLRRISLYETPRDTHAILDIAKVADILVFVLGVNQQTNDDVVCDDFGLHCLATLKSQGLPAILGVTQGIESTPAKKHQNLKKTAQRFFDTAFGEGVRNVCMDALTPHAAATESQTFFRWLADIKLHPVQWRDQRPFLLAEQYAYAQQDNNTGTLFVRGYLRGERGLTASSLIHLTGYGDFQIQQIDGQTEDEEVKAIKSGSKSKAASRAVSRRNSKDEEDDEMAAAQAAVASVSQLVPGEIVLQRATDESCENLDGLVPLDPLAHEQSLIDDDEFADDDEHEHKGFGGKKSIQDAWDAAVPRSDDEDEDGHEDPYPADREDAVDNLDADYNDADDDAHLQYDEDEGDMHMGESKQQSLPKSEKEKLEHDDLTFPDEVDYPGDTQCRVRFQRYRGLKSFNKSVWDVRENLPLEYSQIYQFANFEASKNRILKESAERFEDAPEEELKCVDPTRTHPVTIHITGVSPIIAQQIMASVNPLVCFGLFKYEHKVSVLHFLVKRMAEYQAPIKGKEELEFHVGFRRFTARPIFTSNNKKGNKNLVERFFHADRFVTVTVYGRIMFSPAPVTVFRPHVGSVFPQPAHLANLELLPSVSGPLGTVSNPIVASGTLSSVNPDRLNIKRIILTGNCVNVHKRAAVVRHMFFNAEDIRWFKPIELWTKKGLVGHIRESRGTKGYMKCLFDKFIQQNDTVCMSLYKRQYPPWDPQRFATNN